MKQVIKQLGTLSVVMLISLLMQACVSNDGLSKKNSTDAAQYNAQLGAGFLRKGELEQARIKLEKALKHNGPAVVEVITRP